MTVPTVSVAIPVKDGARYLGDLLGALAREAPDEVLVIDSGSRDGSVDIARAGGADVLKISPEEFGHGRTRNLAVQRTRGELICFLTQDAVPEPGWLEAYRSVMGDERIGAAYGPHLPWPDTSPMIARELGEFFASMAHNGAPELHGAGDLTFLSNVNACYRRTCVEAIGFADVAYSEDQAFGTAMLEEGWLKAYVPAAGVRHAHDYPPVEFARRYFDEARGLADTVGHRAPARPGAVAREVRAGFEADRRYIDRQDYDGATRSRWMARSLLHHSSRRVAEALGSRHERLPAPVQKALSLERRDSGAVASAEPAGGQPPTAVGRQVASRGRSPYDEVIAVAREGPAALDAIAAGTAERERLHFAWVLPPYARGSGGHSTIFGIVRRLEERGHTCSLWMHDPLGKLGARQAGVIRQEIRNWFTPLQAPVFVGFDDWHGADVAIATGWDTAHATARLPGCGARAYFVQDHEPEFYATSAERIWAEETYNLGLFPICASEWLRDLVAERHGVEGTWFRLGVDNEVYRPGLVPRRDDTVIVYARDATARRGVPLAVLALQELVRRRPDTRVVLFGQANEMTTGFDYELLGIVRPDELARQYCEATVGVCLSLTNYSLIPQEMMACGLPCVDVTGGSSEAVFGADGPAELRAPDPLALADGLEALLSDSARWEHRSAAGRAFVADADWEHAAGQVESGLRRALRERER